MTFKRTKTSLAATAFIGGLAAVSGSAYGQADQRIEITGSSIKRVDAETALPVTVINRSDIERLGVSSTQDLVSILPAAFGGTVVASNVGATGVASTAALRSLPSKYTLVLLNGRRVTNFAFANPVIDLNSIPLSAVERIEVLRDGASAVYGADAVAGVINFILRKDYTGLEATIYGTKVDMGGGDSRSVNITGGFGDLGKSGFNVLISANHEEGDVLRAKDRPDFAGSANRPDLGINKASPRNGIPNLNFTDTKGNKYTGVNPLRYNGCNSVEFALVIRTATQCGTDYVKFIDLIPEQRHDNILLRGTFSIGKDAEAYVEALHVKDHTVATYSPAPYTRTMSYPANGRFYPASITLPKGMTLPKGYIMPDGSVLAADTVLAADMAVKPVGNIGGTWRTVAGGGRTDITDNKSQRFVFGVKGSMAGWDYDTALTIGKNDGVISFGPGKFSYGKLTPLVSSGAINVFGPQDAASQAALDGALLSGPEQSAISKSTEFDIKVSREITKLAAGPVGLALGFSARKETLDQISYPVLASGDEVGGGGEIPTVKGDRKVYGLFAELEVPLVKGLDLALKARYDNYKNGFGTSFNKLSPQANLRFEMSKELLFRASAGQGFRAPTLFENLRPFTINNTAANWSDPIRCPGGTAITNTVNPVNDLQDECNVQLSTGVEGSSALKPEKSNQYSLGIVMQPLKDLSITLDYWDVTIKDAILQKSEIQVMSNPTTYANFIYRYNPGNFPDGYQTGKTNTLAGSQNKDYPIAFVYLPYGNWGKVFAAGVDVNVNWKTKSALGSFGVNLDGTYYTKHGYQYYNQTGGLDPKVSDISNYKDFGPTPRWRHALTFSYGYGAWNASLTNNYTAGYNDYTNPLADIGPTYPLVRRVDNYSLWDLQVGWKGIKNLDIQVGVKNILNTDPPSSRTEVNFQTGYDAQWTNPLGRTYWLRAKYKFW